GAARGWLDVWKNLFHRVARPVPLVRFALQWLEANAPNRDGPVVICHGDTGPGNFLFVEDRITKLVDWELTHFGDYHNDLGMMAVRGFQLRGMDGLDAVLAHYARVSGRRVDGWKVRYYRAHSLILGLVTTLKQLDDAVATEKPLVAMPHYLHILPLFQGWLAEALLDLAGLEPEPVDPPAEETDLDQLDVALAFGGIDHVLSDRSLAGGAVSFADLTRHLAARARYGRGVEAAELDDLESLLGHRPANVTRGKAALDAALLSGGLDHEALLRWAWRSSRRQSRLWPAWAAQHERRLMPVADEYLP
ncbi:MAG: phosphotransferase, partial [Novosphingobium sp.]|nr:phosphotransferase [Novosphingobium sp.]